MENAARPRSVVFLTLAQITPPAPIFVKKKPDSIFRTFPALAKKDSPMNQTLRAAVMKINVKKIPAQTMRHAVFVEHFFENSFIISRSKYISEIFSPGHIKLTNNKSNKDFKSVERP